MPETPTTERRLSPRSLDADPHPDESPFLKDAGELKELHIDRLATIAPPLLDIDAYVEEFGRSVVPAYRRGIADRELPADAGLARSIIPPATSAVRDFSRLAPHIPDFLAEKCVGCMACVNACPDTRDPRHRRARAGAGGAHRSLRRRRRRSDRRHSDGHFPLRQHHQVRRRARPQGPGPRFFRDLRGPGPLQGLCRVRGGLRGTRTRRPDHDRQGRPRKRRRASRRSIATSATSASSVPCHRLRTCIGTRRPWPTSCSASTPSAMSAAPAHARAAARRRRSG